MHVIWSTETHKHHPLRKQRMHTSCLEKFRGMCNCRNSSWNVIAKDDAREGKWRGNWRMECVASTLHTTSEHGLSSITTADAHTSAASSWLNWRPRRFKWIRPFRRKTKSGFCACAITFQLASTVVALWKRWLLFIFGCECTFCLIYWTRKDIEETMFVNSDDHSTTNFLWVRLNWTVIAYGWT